MTFAQFLLVGFKYIGMFLGLGIAGVVGISFFLGGDDSPTVRRSKLSTIINNFAFELLTLMVALVLLAGVLLGLDMIALFGIFIYRMVTA